MQQLKGSDTSTAESGSEAEDIASPKASRSFSQVRLTPVREEVILSIKLYTNKSFNLRFLRRRKNYLVYPDSRKLLLLQFNGTPCNRSNWTP